MLIYKICARFWPAESPQKYRKIASQKASFYFPGRQFGIFSAN